MIPAELVAGVLGPPESGGAPGPDAFATVAVLPEMIRARSLFVSLPAAWCPVYTAPDEAVRRGAAALILPPGETAAGATIFRVADTLDAYRALARAWRDRFRGPVAMVLGSVGKTTSKEMVAAALGGGYRHVLRTHGNQNGFVGIALTLLRLRRRHEAAVIEVGIDAIGSIDDHCRVVRADVGLLTRLGPEHLRGFGDVTVAAREEMRGLEEIDARGGTTLVNLDDPLCAPLVAARAKGRRIYYSLGRAASQPPVRAEIVRGAYDPHAELLTVTDPRGRTAALHLPLAGDHNAENLLGAATTAWAMGVDWEGVRGGLRDFRAVGGRSQLRQLPGNITVICDYANASPTSMKAALHLLARLSAGRRSIACLGDMLDLGDAETAYHQQLAAAVLETRPDVLLTVGDRMRHLCDALAAAPGTRFGGVVRTFRSRTALTRELIELLEPGSVVLIKGSRDTRMDRVWMELGRRYRAGRPAPAAVTG